MATVEDLKGGRKMPDAIMEQWTGDVKEPPFKPMMLATIKLSQARSWTRPMVGLLIGSLLATLLGLVSIYASLALTLLVMVIMGGHSTRVVALKKHARKLTEDANERVKIVPATEGEKEKAA